MTQLVGKPYPSPHGRTYLTFTNANWVQGIRQAKEAAAWMEQNRYQFLHIQVSAKLARNDGKPYRVPSPHSGAVARYLLLIEPSLKDTLSIHDEPIDCFGLLPVSWLDIDESQVQRGCK